MKPLLSIIIPAFNSGAHIAKCVSSALDLRIPKEIIIVDDGSTDSTRDIIPELARNSEVKAYRQANSGVSEARNLGLSKSKGDIIAFVDSDDLIIKDGFERLYSRFAESSADMIMGGVEIRFASGETETRQAAEEARGKTLPGQECFAALMRSNTFTPLVFSYLFRKSFIGRIGVRFRHRMSEDDLWTSEAMCLAQSVEIAGGLHYAYCKRADSITGSNPDTAFRAENHLAVANDLYEFIRSHSLSDGAQSWLCCKTLYIASIAVGIYKNLGHWDFSLDTGMYQDLIKRIVASSDEYAKRAGLMFGMRIINDIKSKSH